MGCLALRLSRAREKQAGPGASAAACGQEAQGRGGGAGGGGELGKGGQPERAVLFLAAPGCVCVCGSLGGARVHARRRLREAKGCPRCASLSLSRQQKGGGEKRRGNFPGWLREGGPARAPPPPRLDRSTLTVPFPTGGARRGGFCRRRNGWGGAGGSVRWS